MLTTHHTLAAKDPASTAPVGDSSVPRLAWKMKGALTFVSIHA